MNVSLTPEIQREIDERMASGLYTSSSELVREALRLFFSYDNLRQRELVRLNEALTEGIAQLDRGEGITGDESRRRTRARLDAKRASVQVQRTS